MGIVSQDAGSQSRKHPEEHVMKMNPRDHHVENDPVPFDTCWWFFRRFDGHVRANRRQLRVIKG
jgi:hypothetical protein